MSLFHAKDAVDGVKAAVTDHKAAKAAANPFQQVMAENATLRDQNAKLTRALRNLAPRVDALEGRADQQEQWNTECELYVKKNAEQVPAWQCTGCKRALPPTAGNFPNMGRSKAMTLGIDRLCRECLSQ